MLGIQNPFPVRIPFPIRWNGGAMEPDTIQFDGKTIRIRYHKRCPTRFWWDGAAIHEVDWLPNCRTENDVITHFVRQQPSTHRFTKAVLRERILAQAKFTRCGKGVRVRLNGEMADGMKVAGGQDSIYLLSHCGEAGALRLLSGCRQSYPLRGFRIGTQGDWPDFLEVTAQPIELEVVDA